MAKSLLYILLALCDSDFLLITKLATFVH